jgi:hypothetical protein
MEFNTTLQKTQQFQITLSRKHWNLQHRGWLCDALNLDSAKVIAIYHKGREIDTNSYFIKSNIVQLNKMGVREFDVVISLDRGLPCDDQENSMDNKKLIVEKDKNRVALLQVMVTAIIGVLGMFLTYHLAVSKERSEVKFPHSPNLIADKVGGDIAKLLPKMPPDSISIILESASSTKPLLRKMANPNEFLLPANYEKMKKLADLGFFQFGYPASDFDAVLEKVRARSFQNSKGTIIVIKEKALSDIERKMLLEQSYGLDYMGQGLANSSVSLVQNQIDQIKDQADRAGK